MVDTRLFSLVPGVRKLIAGKVICLWIRLLANIAFAFAIVDVVRTLTEGGKYTVSYVHIGYDACIIVCAAIISLVCSMAAARCGTAAGEQVKLALRKKLYHKLLRLGPSYSQHVRTSDIVQSAGEGIDQIQSFFELFLPQVIYAVLAPITLFVCVAPLNMPTALVLLLCAPLIVIIVGMVAMRASRVFKQYWGQYTDMGAAFLDNVQGLATLKNFDDDERAASRMDTQAERFRIMTMKVLQIQLRSLTAMDVVAYGGTAAGICVAVIEYMRINTADAIMNTPALTGAGVLFIILLAADFFIPLRQLGSYFHVAMNGMTSTKRIFVLLDVPNPQRGTHELPQTADSFTLECTDVSFAYPQEHSRAALSAVNCVFPAQSLTAIVGESGFGKSTLAQVLAGSLDGYQGSIQLSNGAQSYELSSITEASLHNAVVLVGAQSYLFEGSIRENLLMANPCASDEELLRAMERAQIHDIALDYYIQQGAANLSGGQRQRIALARALVHDAPIMIFDEATSSVDVESERAIVRVIDELRRTKTVIMITHRLANAVDADTIVVLNHGTIDGIGTHDELMHEQGIYPAMFETQQSVERVHVRERNTGITYNDQRIADMQVPRETSGDVPGADVSHDSSNSQYSNVAVVARLLKQVRPLKWYMVAASACGAIGHIAATFLPVFGVYALFAAMGKPIWGIGVIPALIIVVVCGLVRGCMRYVEQYLNHNVAFRLLATLRHTMFDALRKLAPAKLDGKGKGDLVAMVTSDVELLEIFFAHTISPTVIAVTTSIVYAVFLAFLSPWMALLLIVAHVVIGILLPLLFSLSLHGVGGEIRGEASALDNRVLDDMRGMEEIIRFGQGRTRLEYIVQLSKRLWQQRTVLSRKNGLFTGLGGVLVMVSTAAAAFLAVALYSHAASSGSVAACVVAGLVLIASSFGSTLALSALPANLTQTFAAARRLFALMDEEPTVIERGVQSVQYNGMALDRVSFAYHDDSNYVLQNYSLRIPVSGILGIQGVSGQGKSTILKLLMRYYDPERGSIDMSGVGLPDIDAHTRRKRESLMTQETYLFDGSIADNLRIANKDASDDDLREALRRASALDLVDSLGGLDVAVGELGGRLSEGERQRIGLARVFLRNADLILLDEPTSRLDALNEAIILHSINEEVAARNCAVVLVSHRGSTMRIADEVVGM